MRRSSMKSGKRLSRFAMTPEKITRWTKEGRGRGEGADYKPWLTVHDVPSKGVRVRVWSARTKRIHHLMSMLEYLFFIILESDPDILDIWEQFPLDLEKTKAISARLGPSHYHPWDRRTECLVVMTTDLVYNKVVNGRIVRHARCLKYPRDLRKPRTIIKIEIEHQCWLTEPDSDFAIITETAIPRALIRNLRWLRGALRPDSLEGFEEAVPMVEAFLQPLVRDINAPLADLTSQADKHFGLDPGSSLTIVKWLLAHREWITNLDRHISTLDALKIDSFRRVAA
jgi:hypothetical protein